MEETETLHGVKIKRYAPGERDTPLSGSNSFCDRSIKIKYKGVIYKNIRILADFLNISHQRMYLIVREGEYEGHEITKVRL